MEVDEPTDPPSRLSRRLGTIDAVTIGLASMIGAGIFAAIGPAADAAGAGLLLGLVVAGTVAYCNATSSAQLAARYPESGGMVVAATVAVVDLRGAIGFSSFAVLVYYAVTNAAAWTLPRDDRRWPRAISAIGFVGCLALVASLPLDAIVAGCAVVGVGLVTGLTLGRLRA